ncbi:uncharacterized protein ISCGN_025012 [Ixodes scapularis]
MYPLFETARLFSLGPTRRDRRPTIVLSAFGENARGYVLVLSCSNGHLVFYSRRPSEPQPRVWSLPWSPTGRPHRDGDVAALCLAPCGMQLVLITTSSTLHTFCLAALLETGGQRSWSADDTVGIRLQGNRGKPTCICSWQTLKGTLVVIVGTEHGEVCLVDLAARRQVGAVGVGHAVTGMEVVSSAVRHATQLLVTDAAHHHWHLLLEDKSSGHDWLSHHSPGPGATSGGASEWRLWASPDREESATLLERSQPQQPRRISKLGKDVVLGRQVVQGRQCLTANDTSTCQLEVYDGGDVARRASCVFAVPLANARHVALTDQLLFVVAPQAAGCSDTQVHLFSKAALDLTTSSKKKECTDPSLQRFTLPEAVLALYRCPQLPLSAGSAAKADPSDVESAPLPSETFLEGCLLVTPRSIYHCRPRCSAERLFLRFTASPASLPSAEHLGALLGLDIFSLYEVAAEVQLLRGQFPQAVRLYQLSKCPQLKRVAHFVSRGYLSELLAYVQVLFGTRAAEIPSQDRVHFANVAALCFVQQVLAKRRAPERDAVAQAFRDFLQENLYYDASVVMRMLSEQRLYQLLYHCALLRGQRRLMVEQLLHFDPSLALDSATCSALASRGYGSLLVQSAHDQFAVCVTDPDLLLPLCCDPALLGNHLRLLADLLPTLGLALVGRVARMYDASRPAVALAVRRVLAASSKQGRYPGSSSSLSTDSLDLTQSEDDSVAEEDVVKFLLFVLLTLNRRRGGTKRYASELLRCDPGVAPSSERTTRRSGSSEPERSVACGQSHCTLVVRGKAYTWGRAQFGRLGHREGHRDVLGATCVETLDALRLRVGQVDCGTHHTLFNTDAGVFACGSSRYGQLGLGPLQRTWVPHLLEPLAPHRVARVACGTYHSLAVTEEGRLFTWGWGAHGQLGHGTCDDQRTPRLVAALADHRVTDASAGCGHTVALTAEGLVFGFGCNTFGQLGLGRSPKRSTPQRIDLGEPVRMLSSGFFQVFALLAGGRLLTWGANPQSLRLQAQSSRRSRLQAVVAQNELLSSLAGGPHGGNLRHPAGPAPSTSPATQALLHGHQGHLTPTEFDISGVRGTIAQIACGSNHAAIVTKEGQVYTWGRNTEGQLGLGHRKDQKSPQLVASLGKVVQVCCGRDFTVALDAQGKVWAWGQNDAGQLGVKVSEECTASRHSRVLLNRLITIRTSRCLITIPQGQRTGEPRPVEVAPLPPEIIRPPPDDLDLLLRQKACHNAHASRCFPGFDLSSLDDPPYGPKALHAALEAFRGSYDPTAVINHCVGFSDFQAAAKISLLEGQFAQAVQYQFQAQLADVKADASVLSGRALEAVNYYTGLIDKESSEVSGAFFENIVRFWEERNLPVEPLEELFRAYLPGIGYSLGLVLFCAPQEAASRFASRLSTNLCLSLAAAMRERVTSGRPHGELIGALLERSATGALVGQIRLVDESAGWEAAVPPHRLWDQLLRSLRQGLARKTALEVSPSEVEQLTQALLAERASRAAGSPCDALSECALVFSCGHHSTATSLHQGALPQLQDWLLRKLPRPLPLTAKLLSGGYAAPGILPLACPRCVVAEVRNNW